MLLGLNCGRAIDNIALPESAKAVSSERDFDLKVGIYLAHCYGGLESVCSTRFTIDSFFILLYVSVDFTKLIN